MAHRIGDLIKETAAAGGLGAFTLTTVADFRAFSSELTVDGDTTWYAARNGAEYEIGLGTRTSATTLARTTVLRSSNGNAPVNFTAAPTVICTVPAAAFAPPSFRAYRDTNQTGVADSVMTRIAFNSETLDTHGAFNAATGIFTAPITGSYQFRYSVFCRGGSLSTALVALRKNGADVSYSDQNASISAAVRCAGGDMLQLNAGDTVDLAAYLVGTGLYVDGSSDAQTTFSGNYVASTSFAVPADAFTPEPWHLIGNTGEPAFENGFVNYDASHKCGFYKHQGRVYMRGLVKGNSSGGAILTLPPGYRPPQEARFATNVTNGLGMLYVGPSGVVSLELGNPGASGYASLDVISFRVD